MRLFCTIKRLWRLFTVLTLLISWFIFTLIFAGILFVLKIAAWICCIKFDIGRIFQVTQIYIDKSLRKILFIQEAFIFSKYAYKQSGVIFDLIKTK